MGAMKKKAGIKKGAVKPAAAKGGKSGKVGSAYVGMKSGYSGGKTRSK